MRWSKKNASKKTSKKNDFSPKKMDLIPKK